ncbi:uncharacterized protein BX664DRAFT_325830 [Halteromyces radiatus]|uniref:uncharacterized protein n=1 Tax=Halteromyces radiatus TaxID=101107 RepID=UPI0022204F07|nr:uncharacterized protein BX664DRAFT_325830 [Halteromyces radiatus]KAI8097218.1 hypothetical protein BX664DRAFT_325830 [Halteromyces radiatus]
MEQSTITYLDPHTIQELEALRGKLGSLQETLSTQIAYLKEPKFHFTWPDLLNKFNMLTAKFSTLSEDFHQFTQTGSTATLPKLMLHPWNPPLTEQDTNIFSVLLRTKLIPDIEAVEKETLRTMQQEMPEQQQQLQLQQQQNLQQQQERRIDEEQMIKDQLRQWQMLRERHDMLAVEAARLTQELAATYGDIILLRVEDDNDKSNQDPEWKQQGFSSEETWKRYKLECMMTFYSMGKDELAGSDLKSK